MRLDRLERPGLSEKDFFGLWEKCDVCGLIMARLVFRYHECRPLGVDGSVELTDTEESAIITVRRHCTYQSGRHGT